jgi:hypothetical protein
MLKQGDEIMIPLSSDHDREFCSAIETLVCLGSCPLLQPCICGA